MVYRVCKWCGSNFETESKGASTRKYCTTACARAGGKRRWIPVVVECRCCGGNFETRSMGSATRKYCTTECTRIGRRTKLMVDAERKAQERQCNICGNPVAPGRDKTGRIRRRKLCSDPGCKAIARSRQGGGNKKPARLCVICSFPTKSRRSRACSLKCGAQLANVKKTLNNTLNKCRYSPRNDHDREFMLDILRRKGFNEGKEKEPYYYEFTSEGDILFRDLPPHPLSDDGKACASEEFQEYWLSVVEKDAEEGSYFSSVKELQRSYALWNATAEEAVVN